MTSLQRIVAAHPLVGEGPYNRIKFSAIDGNGTPVYKIGKGTREFGAKKALREAHQRFGGRCFHCSRPIERGSADLTIDHLRPTSDDGGDYLHNLVLACKSCNREKGRSDLITFSPELGSEYLKALNEHIVRCLKKLGGKYVNLRKPSLRH